MIIPQSLSPNLSRWLTRFGKNKGFIQLPLLIGLLVVSIALPVASKLVSQNQENRSQACNICTTSQYCSSYVQSGCCMGTCISRVSPPPTTPPCNSTCPLASTVCNGLPITNGCGQSCGYGTKNCSSPPPPSCTDTNCGDSCRQPNKCTDSCGVQHDCKQAACNCNCAFDKYTDQNCMGSCGQLCKGQLVRPTPIPSPIPQGADGTACGGVNPPCSLCLHGFYGTTGNQKCGPAPTIPIANCDGASLYTTSCLNGSYHQCLGSGWTEWISCPSGLCNSAGNGCAPVPSNTPVIVKQPDGTPCGGAFPVCNCASGVTHLINGVTICGKAVTNPDCSPGKPYGTTECYGSAGFNYCNLSGDWESHSCTPGTSCSNGRCLAPTSAPISCGGLNQPCCSGEYVMGRPVGTCNAHLTCNGTICKATADVPTATPQPSPTPRPTLGILTLPVGTTISSTTIEPPTQVGQGTLNYGSGYSPYTQTGVDNPLSGNGSCTPEMVKEGKCVTDFYATTLIAGIGLASAGGLVAGGGIVGVQSAVSSLGTVIIPGGAALDAGAAVTLGEILGPTINTLMAASGIVGAVQVQQACARDNTSQECILGLVSFELGGAKALAESIANIPLVRSVFSESVTGLQSVQQSINKISNFSKTSTNLINEPYYLSETNSYFSFDGYKIVNTSGDIGEELGYGHYGTTYLKGNVVTKVSNSGSFQPEDIYQIQALKKLTDANAPGVSKLIGVDPKNASYQMTYIPGISLQDFAKSGGKLTDKEIRDALARYDNITNKLAAELGDHFFDSLSSSSKAPSNTIIQTNRITGKNQVFFIDIHGRKTPEQLMQSYASGNPERQYMIETLLNPDKITRLPQTVTEPY